MQVFNGVESLHFLLELQTGIVHPFEVLTLHFETHALVLLDGFVLDLVHLVKLALEYHEVSALLGGGVDHIRLVLLKSVNYLQEVPFRKKKLIVIHLYFLLNLLNGE